MLALSRTLCAGFADAAAKIINHAPVNDAHMPSDLDPERFTLRQAAQARDDFAQVMEELDLVKELLARLPTRRDQALVPLKIMSGSAVLSAALVIGWIELFRRHCL